ncbi:MAG: Stk1 family PASTA domain-containing Ser/Thr kinase [Oscillospiraceae bacterium]|nr:Stk1 family PASTA domain-containing Ser/Thr kinase [Oscillospiraceae bacterium]
MDNYIGMKLDGRYELLELIGSGGMAEIYKASDNVENKTVAVKILKNEFAGSDDFLRRFRNESKAIALLSHENIVKIFDVGFTDSVQFIVMEYVDGLTLTEYVERHGVLKWKEALQYTNQVLKALQHAHDRGIVHRDVKPQNVMLLRDGSIKVMDFGIARFNREIGKTMSEKAIGSVHYISPEQSRGDTTDEKSDLYSVGIMLYEMLTGAKPFDGEDALAIALMHTNTLPKTPREINSSIPEGLEEIIMRAMQKQTTQRYQTSSEMLNDLQEFEKNPSIIFEYKYFTPSGETKHFDKVGKPAPNPAQNKNTLPPPPVDELDEYDEDEIAERRSPLLPILFAVASVFVIFAAVLIAYVVGNMLDGEGNSREMPDLYGMHIDEVRATYDWLAPRLNFEQEWSPDVPAQHIMSQSVLAGRTINLNQTTVDVIVSKGRQVVTIPDFAEGGRPRLRSEIVTQLNALGLVPIFNEYYSDEVPFDAFIRSVPAAGEQIDVGNTVRVWVSLGPEDGQNMTVVPSLMGQQQALAENMANESNLTPNVTHEYSSEEQRGLVVNQIPPAGTEVPNGTIIVLTIGQGPPEDEPERESYIEFRMPIEAQGVAGVFEFILHRNGVPLPPHTQNVTINPYIRFEFSDVETQQYSVVIRNPANGLEGVFVTYTIDFSQEPPEKIERVADNHVLNSILQPATTTGIPVPTTPTPTLPPPPDGIVP